MGGESGQFRRTGQSRSEEGLASLERRGGAHRLVETLLTAVRKHKKTPVDSSF